MFRKDNAQEESNFWISYADLMAGLLFVFILLIGAIVSKSSILQIDLSDKETKLDLAKHSLTETKDIVLEDERIIKLKSDEIEKLNKMLLAAKNRELQLNDKIIIVQTVLDKNKKALEKEQKSLADYQGKVLVLSNELSDTKQDVQIKDEKLLAVLNAMDERKTKYDALVANLQAQKAKIKSLTGMKLKVLAALKEALGSKIDIDKKTGSLRLASNVLFDSGTSKLKPEAKVALKEAFEEYIGILVTNKEIAPHLDKIIIEGHTDSVGTYIFNLNLSQKRALAVMEYLLTLPFTQEYHIQPLMTASGRAYLDAILVDGVEDKEASRRIEIKFRLKNEDAMHEIETILDAE
ncbi:MAG: OmpA family protein [Sulfurovum sp.]|nr:OmpA family protein [Sulfurovum sp.]